MERIAPCEWDLLPGFHSIHPEDVMPGLQHIAPYQEIEGVFAENLFFLTIEELYTEGWEEPCIAKRRYKMFAERSPEPVFLRNRSPHLVPPPAHLFRQQPVKGFPGNEFRPAVVDLITYGNRCEEFHKAIVHEWHAGLYGEGHGTAVRIVKKSHDFMGNVFY